MKAVNASPYFAGSQRLSTDQELDQWLAVDTSSTKSPRERRVFLQAGRKNGGKHCSYINCSRNRLLSSSASTHRFSQLTGQSGGDGLGVDGGDFEQGPGRAFRLSPALLPIL